MEISVIVAVYNAEQYLHECIDSLIHQTFTDFEILCIDDGSTDRSLAILKEYANHDSRVKVIHQNNCGAGASRNLGIRLAQGKYLSILDADDFFEHDFLQNMYVTAERNQCEIVACNFFFYDNRTGCEKLHTSHKTDARLPYNAVISRNLVLDDVFTQQIFNGAVWNKLYLRDFVVKEKLYFLEPRECSGCEDIFFSSIASILAERIVIIKTPLVHYRDNLKTSLSMEQFGKFREAPYLSTVAIKNELLARGLYDKVESSYSLFVIVHLFSYFYLANGNMKYWFFVGMREDWFSKCGLDKVAEKILYKDVSLYYRYSTVMAMVYDEYIDLERKRKEAIRKYICDILSKMGQGRKIAIWGRGRQGKILYQILRSNSSESDIIFIDRNENVEAQNVECLMNNSYLYYVMISPEQYYPDIETRLEQYGFSPFYDYFYISRGYGLSDYHGFMDNVIEGNLDSKVQLHIYGKWNRVYIDSTARLENSQIFIYGDYNVVCIGENVHIGRAFYLTVANGAKVNIKGNILIGEFVQIFAFKAGKSEISLNIPDYSKCVL